MVVERKCLGGDRVGCLRDCGLGFRVWDTHGIRVFGRI
jgi:hypothetical protein